MDPKLAILFALIGAIVGLSHFRDQGVARLKQIVVRPDWRLVRRRLNR
ncbi:MAG TPA: hypothetical protein VG986_15960 [Pseudolabrys sp.]|nr:hypothetical protein [Pseudolabrys sp.]